jgi:acetyltransferase-like isoleucine patch superfamily enzyme
MSSRISENLQAFLVNVRVRLTLANIASRCLPNFCGSVVRAHLYRLAGFRIEAGANIVGSVNLVSGSPDFYANLIIGRNTSISHQVTINLDGEVRIGANVSISPHVLIYTGTHHVGPESNRRHPAVLARPVIIEDGCWICLGAIILPGVTVGHGSIVAAGAVVTRDVPPNSFVAGVPAQVVRQLPVGDAHLPV